MFFIVLEMYDFGIITLFYSNLTFFINLAIFHFSGLGLDDLGSSHQHHHHHHAAGQGRQEKVDLLEAVGLFGNIGNFSVRHQGNLSRGIVNCSGASRPVV